MAAVVAILMAALVLLLGGCVPDNSPSRGPSGSLREEQRRYIESVAPLAQASQRRFGVPASVAIGQSIVESGWGKSGLTVWGRGYFGIKCGTQQSRFQTGCISLSSLEYDSAGKSGAQVSQFRTYATTADSFVDHGALLRGQSLYAAAFRTKDPHEFIRRVATAGYATDPHYAESVIAMIERYGLTSYDTGRAEPVAAEAVSGPIGEKWRSMGAGDSPLGAVIGAVQDGPNAMDMVVFDRGVMLYSRQHGAHSLTGPVWDLYRGDRQVRERLGVVTGDPEGLATTTVQRFTGGRIVVENGRAQALFS